MTFKPEDRMMKLKGNDYLATVWRVVWLRDEHPDAQIDTEIIFWDHDKQEIMIRATVVLPQTGARATAHCMCSQAEFKFGYSEKAETQAIGRALALLGYGTAFAGQDLDEGERIADSTVTAPAAKNGGVGTSSAATASTTARPVAPAAANGNAANAERQAPSSDSGDDEGRAARGATGDSSTATKTSPSTTTRAAQDTDWTGTVAQLRARIERDSGLELRTGQDWANLARLYDRPEPLRAADMTQEWLLALHQEMTARGHAAQIEAATSEAQVTTAVQRALGDRDKRHVSAATEAEARP